MIVIDATIAIAWAFHEEEMADQLGERLLAERLIAPALWRLDVLNVVLKKERQRILRPDQGANILRDLDAIGVKIVDLIRVRTFEHLASLARPHQLTA